MGWTPHSHVNIEMLVDSYGNCHDEDDIWWKYRFGQNFLQAFWELLFNKCTLSGVNSSENFGNCVWPTSNQEEVIENMGGALAWALKAVPRNTTHDALANKMLSYIYLDMGWTPYIFANAVFATHGVSD